MRREWKQRAIGILVLAICVVLVMLAGGQRCSDPVGTRRNTTAPPSEKVKRWQIAYCGCGGEAKLRQDLGSDWGLPFLDRDDLCGRNDIVFRSHYPSNLEPTELEDLPIFRIIKYTENETGPQVVKDERPTPAYIKLGVLECPLNWYYWSTLEGYLLEKIAAVGGHAILVMEIYEHDRVLVPGAREIAAEVFLMSVTAQVIRFPLDGRYLLSLDDQMERRMGDSMRRQKQRKGKAI